MSVHAQSKAHIDALTMRRLSKLPATDRIGHHVLENFAVFIDTHRDQPHVGVFDEDIHRGQCRPVMVDYDITIDSLIEPVAGQILLRHDKHMFVTGEYFAQFLLNALMTQGADPRDGNGRMPTSHFRDARAKKYDLKSFREIVRLRAIANGIS